jgi:L-malate glycosyltransferase
VRVLFINHTSRVSGAERSLLELVTLLRDEIDPVLACPEGELTWRARRLGIHTVNLDALEVGFSSSLGGILKASLGALQTGLQLRRLAEREGVDVLHAASPRAGLLLLPCMFSRQRRLVDVRDVLPRGAKATLVKSILRVVSQVIVFNSNYTHRSFGTTTPASGMVVYPPVDLERFINRPLPTDEPITQPTLGMIGQITPWKAQDDAIRILAAVRDRIPNVTLRIIGSAVFTGVSVRFDNEAFNRRLTQLTRQLDVSNAVTFEGEVSDIGSALDSIDVLLVPSWVEPFGRVVIEGMAAGVPVVATLVGGPSEVITHGETGFLVPPRQPAVWAEIVIHLLSNPAVAKATATAGRDRVVALFAGSPQREQLLRLYGSPAHAAPEPDAQTAVVG